MTSRSAARVEAGRHDLRQPLAAILAAATALQSAPSIDAETRAAFIDIVVENAKRLDRLIADPTGESPAGA